MVGSVQWCRDDAVVPLFGNRSMPLFRIAMAIAILLAIAPQVVEKPFGYIKAEMAGWIGSIPHRSNPALGNALHTKMVQQLCAKAPTECTKLLKAVLAKAQKTERPPPLRAIRHD